MTHQYYSWTCSEALAARLNGGPQIHVYLDPVKRTLFGNRVFADVIKLIILNHPGGP